MTALDRNNGSVGAGYIEKRGEQYLIRAPGQVRPWRDIGNVILSSAGGVPIRVRDVADVGLGRELRTGAATDNGREGGAGALCSCSSARTAVRFANRTKRRWWRSTAACRGRACGDGLRPHCAEWTRPSPR